MKRQPLQIEIVAYAPTAYYHCTHCEVVWKEAGFSQGLHEEQVASALPLDMLQEYQAVSDWVRRLFALHCDRVAVKVIDAASLEGVWITLRHGVRKYPAVIVGGQTRIIGTDFEAADVEIFRQLEAVPAIE